MGLGGFGCVVQRAKGKEIKGADDSYYFPFIHASKVYFPVLSPAVMMMVVDINFSFFLNKSHNYKNNLES